MKEFEFIAKLKSKTNLMRVIGIAALVLLAVTEIIICAEYASVSFAYPRNVIFGVLVSCCVCLDIACVLEIYYIKPMVGKIVLYSIEFVFLFAVSLLTSTVYLSVLFCIALTQAYAGLAKFRDEVIIFAAGCAVYVIAYVTGWYVLNTGADPGGSAMAVVSNVVFGLMILAVHFIVVTFLLRFYRINQRLIAAVQEVDKSRAELKELYEQLTESAVYEERNRIAGDIHDNAGHSMTTVIMQTEAAKRLMDTNPEEAKKAIISANIQAKSALDQMRESVHLLAGRSDTGSLKSAIEEIVAQTIDGTNLKIRCNLDDVQADAAQLRFIGTSVKEALANGIRHGGATAFYIETKAADGTFTVLVSDNGSGLKADFCEGFGLAQIRRKAEALGGSMSIAGDGEDGCELKITLPLKKQI